MSRFRAYIKPFLDNGVYADDYIEVTDDLDFSSIGKIKQSLDNSQFDIGVFRFSSFAIDLNNREGRYSDITVSNSIFRYKRSDSLFRLDWAISEPPICGTAVCGGGAEHGAVLAETLTLFEGLISDESSSFDLDDQMVSFQVLGLESVLSRALTPFSSISNGDLLSEILYACLNQTAITGVLTVSQSNIDLDVDITIDDNAWFEGKTVKQAVEQILLHGNSVLRIISGVVYVSPRDASADLKQTFYGPASGGIENIIDVKKITSGASRIINVAQWRDTATIVKANDSIDRYGVRRKEFNWDPITDSSKRTTILTAVVTEFGNPRQEFDAVVPFNYTTKERELLDRVAFDYPLIAIEFDGNELPIYGIAKYDDAVYPVEYASFTLSTVDEFKVLGKSIDTQKGLLTLHVRGV